MSGDGQRAASLLLEILDGRKDPGAVVQPSSTPTHDQLSIAYNRLNALSQTLRAQQDASVSGLNLSVGASMAADGRGGDAVPARAPEAIPQLEELRVLGTSGRHTLPQSTFSISLARTEDAAANSRAAAAAIRSMQEKIRRLEGDSAELRQRLDDEKKRSDALDRQGKEREAQRLKDARDAALREEVLRRDNAELLRSVENLRAELRTMQGAEGEKRAALSRMEEIQKEADRKVEERQREWVSRLQEAEQALASCREELATARGRAAAGGTELEARLQAARRAEQEERARRVAAEEARAKGDEATRTLLALASGPAAAGRPLTAAAQNEELVARLEDLTGGSTDAGPRTVPRALLAKARRKYEMATGRALGSGGACPRYQRPASVRRKLPTDFADEVSARTSAETLFPLPGGLQASLRAVSEGNDPFLPAGKTTASHSLPVNVQRGLADRPRAAQAREGGWLDDSLSSAGTSEGAAGGVAAVAAAREEALVDPNGQLAAAVELLETELGDLERPVSPSRRRAPPCRPPRSEYRALLVKSQAAEGAAGERAALSADTLAVLQRVQQKAEQLKLLKQHRAGVAQQVKRFLPAPGAAAEQKVNTLRLYRKIKDIAA